MTILTKEEGKKVCEIFRDCYRNADGLLELCSKCGFIKRRVICGHSDSGSYTPSVGPGYPPHCKCKRDVLGDLAVEILFWLLNSKNPEFTKTLLEKYRKDSKKISKGEKIDIYNWNA